MNNHLTDTLDRRTAIGGAALLAATAGLFGHPRIASAQSARADYSDHPMAGMWLALPNAALPTNPMFAAPSFFSPDGYSLFSFPPVDIGENGLFYQSAFFGVWEPVDDTSGRWHGVSMSSDATGLFTGTTELDTVITILDDGTFIDDGSWSRVTVRDALHNVLLVIEPTGEPNGRPPVTARKMTIDDAGFPAPPPTATPTS
jgi:hypothetical protein